MKATETLKVRGQEDLCCIEGQVLGEIQSFVSLDPRIGH